MAASLKEVGEQPNGLGGGLDGALAFVLRAAGAAELQSLARSGDMLAAWRHETNRLSS
jgi:hypothetical protein